MSLFRYSFILTCTLLGGPGRAQDISGLDRMLACSNLTDTAERLPCFDEALRDLQISQGRSSLSGHVRDDAVSQVEPATPVNRQTRVIRNSEGQIEFAGNWLVIRSVDEMTDRSRITLSARGEVIFGRRVNEDAPLLGIRCFSSRIEIFVITPSYLGTRRIFDVAIRFDTAPSTVRRWNSSSNGMGAFSQNGIEFLNDMRAAEKFLIEITSFDNDKIRMSFSLEGFQEIASEISACWRYPGASQPQSGLSPGPAGSQRQRGQAPRR